MENSAKVKNEPLDNEDGREVAAEEPRGMDFEQVSVKEEHEICEPICELKEEVAVPVPPPITIQTTGIHQRFLLTPVILAPPVPELFTYLSPKVKRQKKQILPKTFIPVNCINAERKQSFLNNFNIPSIVDKATVTIINQIQHSANINRNVQITNTHKRPMKKGWLSDADKEKIPNMHAQGISNGQIARQLGCTKTTVARWLNRWETEGHVSARTMPGRPRITTPQQDAQIIEELKKDKNVTSKEIQDKLKFYASKHTIIRRLRESKEVSKYEPSKKNVKAIRLAFAREFIDRPMEFWMKIIFCDQYKFSYSQGGQVTVQRPRRISRTTSGEKFSVTVWGWTTCEGFGKLWQIDGRLSSVQNLVMIRDIMIPSFTPRFPDGDFYIMHDKSSPLYTSKKARGWAQDTGLCVVNWPPKSSDMNLIGRVCNEVKRMLNKSCDPPRSRDEFSCQVHQAWGQLMTKAGSVSSLVQDIPCRLSAIILESKKRKKRVKQV